MMKGAGGDDEEIIIFLKYSSRNCNKPSNSFAFNLVSHISHNTKRWSMTIGKKD